MPGVVDASVEREAFDTDYWGETIVVDMDLDATAPEVTAVLDAFIDRARSQDGAPQDAHVTLGAGTTDSEGDDYEPEAPPMATPANRKTGNLRVARQLVAATAAFPGANVTVTASEWAATARADGDDPRPVIDRMIAAVRGDDLLSRTTTFALTAYAGPEFDERSVQLSPFDGLTPAMVDHWHDLSPHLDAPEFRSLWLTPEWIDLYVRAGADVRPATLTTAAYGDALWPMLHAALDTLAEMPEPTTFTATNEWDYDVPEVGAGYREDEFLRIRHQRRPAPDRHGRTWNAEAGDYLASATR